MKYNQSRKKMQKKEEQTNKIEIYKLIPIMFAIAVIPIIMRFGIYEAPLSKYSWLGRADYFYDMYLYGKYYAMLILDGVLAAGLVYLAVKKEIPKHIACIPLAIYVILIILSSVFAVDSFVAWNGYPEIRESAFVLLGYCMILLYTFAVVRSERQVKFVMFAFFIGIAVLCFIGALKYFGLDIFMTDFGKALCFSKEHRMYAANLKSTTPWVVSTLLNPNYVGVYCTIAIPILLMLLVSIKKWQYGVIYVLLLVLSGICMIGCGSDTSAFVVGGFFIIFLLYISKRIPLKVKLPIAFILMAVASYLLLQDDGKILESLKVKIMAPSRSHSEYIVEDIILEDEYFVIIYNGEKITIWYEDSADSRYTICAKNEAGDLLGAKYDETMNAYILDDARYSQMLFKEIRESGVTLGYEIVSQNYFYKVCYSVTDQTYYYLNGFGRYTKLFNGDTLYLPVFQYMRGFSDRDYVWSKALPILKETLFLGSGPDNFAIVFPQYDYVQSRSGYNSISVMFTKPHNTYLQIGIQTGVISVLAYIALHVCYYTEFLHLYRKRALHTFTERCGAGIFAASVCYMVSGLINDSSIGVSIVYWTLLGLGFACNRMVKTADGMTIAEDKFSLEDKKFDGMKTLLVVIGFIVMVLAGHLFLQSGEKEYQDGRLIFPDTVAQDIEARKLSYTADMTQRWTFSDCKSVSENAYVGNKTENKNSVWFEVKLENGDIVYTSDVLGVGDIVENIVLTKELEKGEYAAIMTYHILSSEGEEVGTADVNMIIDILK